MSITKESLYNSIDGLQGVQNSPITKVTLNNNEMDVSDLSQFPDFSTDGQVTVDNFLDFMGSEGALETEFFTESTSRLTDGHLIIEPRNVGSKGLIIFESILDYLQTI